MFGVRSGGNRRLDHCVLSGSEQLKRIEPYKHCDRYDRYNRYEGDGTWRATSSASCRPDSSQPSS